MSDIAVKTSDHVVAKDRLTEDWLSVAIGVLVFALALFSLSGTDLLGWAITTSVYTNLAQALAPFAKGYAWLGGGGSLLATYAALLVVLSIRLADHGKLSGGEIADRMMSLVVCLTNASRNGVLR